MFLLQRLKVTSHLLYESVADKINYVAFFRDFNLPNTFNSWFLVTELHVWLLLMRSMAEGSETGEDGRFLRNCIVEAMWGDVNTRAKKLGVSKELLIMPATAQCTILCCRQTIPLARDSRLRHSRSNFKRRSLPTTRASCPTTECSPVLCGVVSSKCSAMITLTSSDWSSMCANRRSCWIA